MTEQEAQEAAEAQAAARAEAEKRWPKPSAGDDLRKFDHQGGFVTGFVEGAVWERSRHSPRVVVAAPSDTDRRLIDALRRKARFFERPEGEGANETELLLNQAADALSRASQPVQVEVNESPCAFQMEQCRCALPRGHGGLHECRVHRFSDRPLAALGGGDHE